MGRRTAVTKPRKSGSALTRPRVVFAVVAAAAIASTPTIAAAAPSSLEASVVQRFVYPDATEQAWTDVRVQVDGSSRTVRVTLRRDGEVLQTATLEPGGGIAVFDGAGLTTGRYVVRVSEGTSSTDLQVRVHRGWAPIAAERPSWRQCRRITWRYDAELAPAGGDRYMLRDIRAALASIASATGLIFVRVRTGGAFVVRWGRTGGADGVGGLEWTDGPGSVARGFVTFSISSEWARTPGTDGRQILLLHESAHAVGLGHVDLPRSLMSPTYRPGTTRPVLGSGERRGLSALYHPSTCR